ncbi:hypothetical protein FRC00_011497, partial [Tulasnella sp. 408]
NPFTRRPGSHCPLHPPVLLIRRRSPKALARLSRPCYLKCRFNSSDRSWCLGAHEGEQHPTRESVPLRPQGYPRYLPRGRRWEIRMVPLWRHSGRRPASRPNERAPRSRLPLSTSRLGSNDDRHR